MGCDALFRNFPDTVQEFSAEASAQMMQVLPSVAGAALPHLSRALSLSAVSSLCVFACVCVCVCVLSRLQEAKGKVQEIYQAVRSGAPAPAKPTHTHSASEEAAIKARAKEHLSRFRRTLTRHQQIELCRVWKKRYGVVPAQHWGSMPEEWRDSWLVQPSLSLFLLLVGLHLLVGCNASHHWFDACAVLCRGVGLVCTAMIVTCTTKLMTALCPMFGML
jgi:hypothetical protein